MLLLGCDGLEFGPAVCPVRPSTVAIRELKGVHHRVYRAELSRETLGHGADSFSYRVRVDESAIMTYRGTDRALILRGFARFGGYLTCRVEQSIQCGSAVFRLHID